MRRKATDKEIAAGIVLQDPLLFAIMFWKGDLTTPVSRKDLPDNIRGHTFLSKEQKLMYCDESKRILYCTGRKVAKSLRLEALIIQRSILNRTKSKDATDEALVFAPAEGHLKPVVERVFARIERIPIFSKMVTRALRGNKPQIDWATGITIWFRVEGTSGTDTNMAGIRAKWVIGDECAFGDFQNHNSRLQTALPEASWIYAGVPNGVRTSPFYGLDQTSLGNTWSRHKYPTFINPLYWSDRAKSEILRSYGSENTPGYITQVMGEWGEAMVSSFPPSSIAMHNDHYFMMDITKTMAERISSAPNMRDMISIPSMNCDAFAIGNDYGFSPDPSVFTIAIQKLEDAKQSVWRYYARITMRQVPMPLQSKIILFIINNLFPAASFVGFASDKMEFIQDLQERAGHMKERFTWAFPAHHIIPVEDNNQPRRDEHGNVVKIGCKQYWTEVLKAAMSHYLSRIPPSPFYYLLGQDDVVINELVGTTERQTPGGYTVYSGMPDPSGGRRTLDHNIDSHRELMAAILHGINSDAKSFTEQQLLVALGWAGVYNRELSWSPPWQ